MKFNGTSVSCISSNGVDREYMESTVQIFDHLNMFNPAQYSLIPKGIFNPYSFDADQFQGSWNLIARTDVVLDRNCANAILEYSKTAPNVLSYQKNCFFSNGSNAKTFGTLSQVPYHMGDGHFYPTNTSPVFEDNRKPSSIRGINAEYLCILATDYATYAIVGSTDRSKAWILSRHATMTMGEFQSLASYARDLGYLRIWMPYVNTLSGQQHQQSGCVMM